MNYNRILNICVSLFIIGFVGLCSHSVAEDNKAEQAFRAKNPVKHKLQINAGEYWRTYEITSEITMKDGCASFTCYDGTYNRLTKLTVCGSFQILF